MGTVAKLPKTSSKRIISEVKNKKLYISFEFDDGYTVNIQRENKGMYEVFGSKTVLALNENSGLREMLREAVKSLNMTRKIMNRECNSCRIKNVDIYRVGTKSLPRAVYYVEYLPCGYNATEEKIERVV